MKRLGDESNATLGDQSNARLGDQSNATEVSCDIVVRDAQEERKPERIIAETPKKAIMTRKQHHPGSQTREEKKVKRRDAHARSPLLYFLGEGRNHMERKRRVVGEKK